MSDEVLSDDDVLEQAAEQIALLDIEIKERQELRAQLVSVFKNPATALKPRPEPYVFGKVQVKVSANSRIDNALALEKVKPAMLKYITKTVVDPTLARKHLMPGELARITKTFDNKIEVRPI